MVGFLNGETEKIMEENRLVVKMDFMNSTENVNIHSNGHDEKEKLHEIQLDLTNLQNFMVGNCLMIQLFAKWFINTLYTRLFLLKHTNYKKYMSMLCLNLLKQNGNTLVLNTKTQKFSQLSVRIYES